MKSESKVEELLEVAKKMPEGDAQVNAYLRAVAEADRLNLEEIAFNARLDLIRAAAFSGHSEITLIHFPWLLAKVDENPLKFSERNIMWTYKWVISSLPDSPNTPIKTIQEVMADFERRFTKYLFNPITLYEYRRIIANEMGHWETAAEAQAQFEQAKPSAPLDRFLGLANCPACVTNNQVTYFIDIGQYEKALSIATPLLAGKESCANVPNVTYARILLPYVKLGKVKEAREVWQKGYNSVKNNRNFIHSQACLLEFLIWDRNFEQAIPFFEQHAAFGEEAVMARERLYYLQIAWLLCQVLTDEGHGETKIRIPKSHPMHQPGNDQRTARVLAPDFLARAQEIALAFDKRNGNNYLTQTLQDLQDNKSFRLENAAE